MSLHALSEYTLKSRYAKYNYEKSRRENWQEMTERVFSMHQEKFKEELKNEEFKEAFNFAKQMVKEKRVFGSQRALQFAPGPILVNPAKIYNCSSTYIDRPKAFAEILYMLLSGCGVGFSVQKLHVNQLKAITRCEKTSNASVKTVVIEDSIEGWSDAVDELINFYIEDGYNNNPENSGIDFDYSQIRPLGAPITGGFKAPGPEPLKKSIDIVQGILEEISMKNRKLRPIEVYDIIMHLADAVISGGVRRSACICMFDKDDEEMINSKSEPFWWFENSQRMRSNNSIVLKRDEVTKEEFDKIFEKTKNYGEPGFVFVNDYQELTNPCGEIGMHPTLYDENKNIIGTSFSCCNLCEIIGSKCKTEEDFYNACKAAAIIGTMQATYTDFNYLDEIAKAIVERDSLLGVSITGMMDMPEVLFNSEIQSKGAELIKTTNEKIAKLLGINPSKRVTCTKPSGSSSILGKTGSGIHPHHSKRYIRRVQSSKDEFCYQFFKQHNPHAVEETVIGDRGKNVAALLFPCEVPSGSITKNQVGAIDFLKKIKLTQDNWIKHGVNNNYTEWFDEKLTHNISNTVVVKDDEWDAVRDFIFSNKDSFCGISLLSMSGDKDYKQPPFVTVHTPSEIVKEYGDGSVMASGVIVDGLHAYDDDLWEACNDVLYLSEDDILNQLETSYWRIWSAMLQISRNYEVHSDFEYMWGHYYGLNFELHSDKAEIMHKYILKLIDRIGLDKIKEYDNTEDLNEFLAEKSEDNLTEEKFSGFINKLAWIEQAKRFADKYINGDYKRMTYLLKDVDNWKRWCDLKRSWKEVPWDEAIEDQEITIDANTMAAQSCSSGACELNI